MKTLNALSTGLKRSVKMWKGILIVWFFYLLFVSLLAIPIRSTMKAGFGGSMITEKLFDGIDIEVLSDLQPVIKTLMSSFLSGLFLAFLLGVVMNAFLSGGLFKSLKIGVERFSASEFFSASGRYFWSYLFITLIISLLAILLAIFILIIPVALVGHFEPDSEKVLFITGIIAGSVFLLSLLILVLVTDYARAWNAAREKPVCFRAIGFGFSRTFKRFRSSYPLLFIITIVQILFAFLVLFLIGRWTPATRWGVFLLFLVSQVLFILRILIKTWRYASVTNLMELNNTTAPVELVNINNVQNNEKTDSF